MVKIGQWCIKKAKSGKHSLLSWCDYLLRLFIVAIFLIGALPVPVLAAPGDGIIAGQIRSDNFTGPFVPGAGISVFTAGSQVPGWNTTTDASGNFTVSVPPGDYRINVYKPGLLSVVQQPVNGVSENITTYANMWLPRGGIIQGFVTDNSSAPLSDASVRAYIPATPDTFYSSLKTGASGNYTVTAPPGDGYVVVATKSGYTSANQTGVTAPAIGAPPTIVNLMMTPPDTTPPAAVSNLAAVNPTSNSANLTWTAPGDNGMSGQAFQYAIRRAGSPITDNASFNAATVVPNALVPKPAGSTENFLVASLSANTTYFFALKTQDQAGNWSGLSNSANTTTQVGGGGGGGPASFSIVQSENRSAFMLSANASTTQTFNITSLNGFTGTVNLTFNAPPQFQSSSLSASSVFLPANQTVPVSLTIRASAQAPAGTSQANLSGQSGAVQFSRPFSLTVGVAGQPLLSASPAMVAAGSQTTFSASQFPPNENVTLRWDSGPYSSQNITSGQIAGDGTWSAQVTIPGGMPGGNFAVKAFTPSNAAAVFQITITSGVGADFMMAASPQFVSVTPGSTANVTVYVTSVNGFNSTVVLMPGSAPGFTSSLSSGNVTPGSGETVSATLTITVAQYAAPQMYNINVSGHQQDGEYQPGCPASGPVWPGALTVTGIRPGR